MRIVIIEDERLIAEDLMQTLKAIDGNFQVLKLLESLQEAEDYFKNYPMPDLFFSDIQLPDGLSFEFFKKVKVEVPVIFVTAFDKYALDAFRANGIDYLLKPYTEENIRLAIGKYKKLKGENSANTMIDFDAILSQYNQKKAGDAALLVNKGDKILALKHHEIVFCYIEDKHTFIISNRQQYRISKTLEQLEKELGSNFFRINRQMLIHRNAIIDVSRYFARKLRVNPTFQFDEAIVVSKNMVAEFLAWWENK